MRTSSLIFTLSLLTTAAAFGCKTKEEILKAAEDKGQTLTETKARLVKGVGEGLQGEGKTAGEALAKGSAQVVRGVEEGAVEGFSAIPVAVSEALTTNGMKAERAAIHRVDPKMPQIKVYLVLDKAYKGPLTLIAKSKEGKEVGRSKLEIDEQDTGKYFLFAFDPLVDLSLASALELR
jgi:hypothetical protein